MLSEEAKTEEWEHRTGSHWVQGDDCLRWEVREGLSEETAPKEGAPGALPAPGTQNGSPNHDAQQCGKARGPQAQVPSQHLLCLQVS